MNQVNLTISVSQFLHQCNWLGTGAPAIENVQQPSSLHRMSVAEFFSQIAWNNELRIPYTQAPFSITTTPWTVDVGIFFAHIPWRPVPEIAPLPVEEVLPTHSHTLSIADVSNLF